MKQKSEYQLQAEKFLADTGTTIDIVLATPQKAPQWVLEDGKHGLNYTVTLKNKKHTYVFDFWGSIADRENRAKPTAYDVLACISTLSEDTFEDFCSSYGYNTDSIKALNTYNAVKEQDRNLRKLFTHDELNALNEIQ